MFGKIVAGVVGGLIPAVLGSFVVAIALSDGTVSGFAFLVLWILALVVAVTSGRPAKAWRRMFIASAIFSFALPLAAFAFAGTAVTQIATQAGEGGAAVTAGAALGGGVIAAMAGFLGFFLGLIFLVIGLLTGRDKSVVVIRETDDRKLA